MNNIDFVIYHKDCSDGFCAAYFAKRKFPDAELYAAAHHEPAPDVTGKRVLIVDFSYPRAVLQAMSQQAEELFVFDHHVTAQQALTGLTFPNGSITFDMNRSGAGITYDELFGSPRHWIVDYVEDRDLWRFTSPNAHEVAAYTSTIPTTLEAWDQLVSMDVSDVIRLGTGILRSVERYTAQVSAEHQVGEFEGTSCAVVNAAMPHMSDVGNALCTDTRFALGYAEMKDGTIKFSLRSKNDIDVSGIATRFGGGGHKHAAGFTLPYGEGRKLVDQILGRAA